MTESIKVLHIMSGFGGGISSFILNKARAFQNQHICFDVLTYDECSDEFVQAIQGTGGNVYQLLNPKKVGWQNFKASFNQVVKNKPYDFVHCHISGYRAYPYYVLSKQLKPAKFMIHAHLTSNPFERHPVTLFKERLNQRITRRLSTAVIGCGQLAIEGTYGSNIPSSKMMIIPNSIDLKQFSSVQSNSSIPVDPVIIGQMARFKPIKNHSFTINFASFAHENKCSYLFKLAGQGPLLEQMEKDVKRKSLEEVEFLGRVKPEDFFSNIHVMLLPSFFEGLPTVVVEAQAAGVPTLMSNTITNEVDLGLGLVQSLSLNAPYEVWDQKIQELINQSIPTYQEREQVIHSKGFSNEASAQLYSDFLFGKINHFQIR